MSESTRPQRLFNEKETSAILKRAAELQGRDKKDELPGLTASELEQIAAEVGIDRTHLNAAIQEMTAGSPEKTRLSLLGGPLSVEMERVFDGALNEDQLERALSEISHLYGVAGLTTHRGSTIEWTFSSRKQQYQVTLTTRNGKTSVRIFAGYARMAAVFFIPLLVLAFNLAVNIPIAYNMAPWFEILISLAIMATAYVGSATIFRSYSNRQEEKARRLMDRLEHIIEQSPQPQQVPIGVESVQSGVPDLLPEPESEDDATEPPERQMGRQKA